MPSCVNSDRNCCSRSLSRRAISRADLAEVVVRSLLDPRACNLACSISASEYAKLAGETQSQDISKMLEVLTPNKT